MRACICERACLCNTVSAYMHVFCVRVSCVLAWICVCAFVCVFTCVGVLCNFSLASFSSDAFDFLS